MSRISSELNDDCARLSAYIARLHTEREVLEDLLERNQDQITEMRARRSGVMEEIVHRARNYRWRDSPLGLRNPSPEPRVESRYVPPRRRSVIYDLEVDTTYSPSSPRIAEDVEPGQVSPVYDPHSPNYAELERSARYSPML